MYFVIQVRDWLICVVWVGINQSRTRMLKNIINSENCYVIYLLYIIDIQMYLGYLDMSLRKKKKYLQNEIR